MEKWILYFLVLITVSLSVSCQKVDDAAFETSEALKILYAQNGEGSSGIYKMNMDGTSSEKVEGIPNNAYGPVLSPDGEKIAFYCHMTSTQWALYVIDLDTLVVKQLTEEADYYDWAISWAPDSQWLYFTRSQMQDTWVSEIFKIKVDGTSLTKIIDKQAQGGNCSPNGETLLFFDYQEGAGDIWLFDLNKKIATQLTTLEDEEWWPSWSPDGKSIVYQGMEDGNFELFTLNLESKAITQLTTSEGDEGEPQYSPDGKYIVYSYFSNGEYVIYKMKSDGSEVTKLSESGIQSINPSWIK